MDQINLEKEIDSLADHIVDFTTVESKLTQKF